MDKRIQIESSLSDQIIEKTYPHGRIVKMM